MPGVVRFQALGRGQPTMGTRGHVPRTGSHLPGIAKETSQAGTRKTGTAGQMVPMDGNVRTP